MNTAVRCSPENDRLLEAARAGDGAAFGRLVEEYRPYLKKVANCILADRLPSDGSDVVQTGLTVAFEKLERFQDGNFLGWLAEIVRNEARQALRARGRLQRMPDGVGGAHMVG